MLQLSTLSAEQNTRSLVFKRALIVSRESIPKIEQFLLSLVIFSCALMCFIVMEDSSSVGLGQWSLTLYTMAHHSHPE